MGTRCANHVTPLYPQKKLALTSPTGGGRSVGVVRSRTKATEFSFTLAVSEKYSNSIVRKEEKAIARTSPSSIRVTLK